MGQHSLVPYLVTVPPGHMFPTAQLWVAIHFAVSCGPEIKDTNHLTANVIPLHEREQQILCMNMGRAQFS